MNKRKYVINVLIGIDQFFSALFLGDPDETISSRIGKVKRKHNGVIPWRKPLIKIIDWGLEQLDPGHSIDSIEDDEGKDEVSVEWKVDEDMPSI